MAFHIRNAADTDIEDLIRLRTEAERWLAENGINQWVPMHQSQSRAILRNAVSQGGAFVVTDDAGGPVVGTVTLGGPDRDWWTQDEIENSAVYIYKMIVAREYAGQGIGSAMLDWASTQAQRAGTDWVRLDCRRDNTALHVYYQRQGFELIRIMQEPLRITDLPRFTGALFQRRSEVRMSSNTLIDSDVAYVTN